MPVAIGGPQGYTPPEGGWGWLVVVGAFISIGFSYATAKSITVFFKEIEVIFNASSSQVSWISSIMLAVTYGGGELHPTSQAVDNTWHLAHQEDQLNQFLAFSMSVKDLLMLCSVKSQSIFFFFTFWRNAAFWTDLSFRDKGESNSRTHTADQTNKYVILRERKKKHCSYNIDVFLQHYLSLEQLNRPCFV